MLLNVKINDIDIVSLTKYRFLRYKWLPMQNANIQMQRYKGTNLLIVIQHQLTTEANKATYCQAQVQVYLEQFQVNSKSFLFKYIRPTRLTLYLPALHYSLQMLATT